MDQHWHALHIFLSKEQLVERFFVDVLLPEIGRLRNAAGLKRWFFIRYWEGGPHIRWRLNLLDPDALREVIAQLRARIGGHLNEARQSREDFYRNHRFDGKPVDAASLPWYDEGSIVSLPYVPEIERYGGVDAMSVNELLFEQSSDAAGKVIRATLGTPTRRLSVSVELLVHTAGLLCATAEDVARFWDGYARLWGWTVDDRETAEKRVEAMFGSEGTRIAQLTRASIGGSQYGNGGSSTLTAEWRLAVAEAVSRMRNLAADGRLYSPMLGKATTTREQGELAIKIVMASQLHMLNNRLGITPLQEYLLARLLAKCARALQ